jgi:ATP-dependent helicase/nuclease subunit A
MSFTPAQQKAIKARGNVLVVAGAGTGKTSTLVERCLDCLTNETPRASLDEILMVTFTDAAAAEMRHRIRARLEERLKEEPQSAHWQEQLALFETAHIGTLHRFCLQLVRQHFYELGLDPQLAVMAEEEGRLLADEILDEVLENHYSGENQEAEAVQKLIQAQGREGDKPIRALVMRLHHYTQTKPDPTGWFDDQLAMLARDEPLRWREWLAQGTREWREQWLPTLEKMAAANDIAKQCAEALRELAPNQPTWRPQAATTLKKIISSREQCGKRKKGAWLDPLKGFFAEADFLFSLVQPGATVDPLTEDWNWVRAQMTTLLGLAREFETAFTEAKRELGVVDFHDLEQYALRLLWDPATKKISATAQHWRTKLRFVFVDEYQDINAAQDKIIEALSRDGDKANRFLVGDVKQSIYRFRLADPRIFQEYADAWRKKDGAGQSIPLVDNFRSREGILQFVNSVFSTVMRRNLGGVDYSEEAKLQFGAPQERAALSTLSGEPCVELRLRKKNSNTHPEPEQENPQTMVWLDEMEEAGKDARLVALRLCELRTQGHPVWDEQAKTFRPVEWRDMAVLLRSPGNKAESYAKEFSRLNVPLVVSRGGFYQTTEISDLRSLLQVLDNPLQDLPLLAVLHSPLVGLALDELATIRLVGKGVFWNVLTRWHEIESHKPQPEQLSLWSAGASRETGRKVAAFLDCFARWRRLARQESLSRGLEAVLTETHYATWLLTQPRGEQRHANVQRFLGLAQQFDQFQRQGLFRFLRFIDAQQLAETEPDVPAIAEENSVRLMSIHQSKGLEFPVVVVADIGKAFNTSDQRADLILDEILGVCPQIKPPHTGKSYPSLPHWLARRRQHREMLGEELRLLYVAMTRARHTLLICGSVSKSKFEKFWENGQELDPFALSSVNCLADWLGVWFARNCSTDSDSGENSMLRWRIHDDSILAGANITAVPMESQKDIGADMPPQEWQRLRERVTWQYPFMPATRVPAKTSVSVLRRSAAEEDEENFDLPGIRQRNRFSRRVATAATSPKVSAVEIGNAHHAFLQLISLERVTSLTELRAEAERLVKESAFAEDQVAMLDFKSLMAFWDSELGKKIRAHKSHVKRELAFTARFSPAEIAELTGERCETALDTEFVVVQGVSDLAVMLPNEIWLVDFKTDAVAAEQLSEKLKVYEPQLKLYARALSRIYKRPVTGCWLYFLATQAAVKVQTL